jgi:hypothetical protein
MGRASTSVHLRTSEHSKRRSSARATRQRAPSRSVASLKAAAPGGYVSKSTEATRSRIVPKVSNGTHAHQGISARASCETSQRLRATRQCVFSQRDVSFKVAGAGVRPREARSAAASAARAHRNVLRVAGAPSDTVYRVPPFASLFARGPCRSLRCTRSRDGTDKQPNPSRWNSSATISCATSAFAA